MFSLVAFLLFVTIYIWDRVFLSCICLAAAACLSCCFFLRVCFALGLFVLILCSSSFLGALFFLSGLPCGSAWLSWCSLRSLLWGENRLLVFGLTIFWWVTFPFGRGVCVGVCCRCAGWRLPCRLILGLCLFGVYSLAGSVFFVGLWFFGCIGFWSNLGLALARRIPVGWGLFAGFCAWCVYSCGLWDAPAPTFSA